MDTPLKHLTLQQKMATSLQFTELLAPLNQMENKVGNMPYIWTQAYYWLQIVGIFSQEVIDLVLKNVTAINQLNTQKLRKNVNLW